VVSACTGSGDEDDRNSAGSSYNGIWKTIPGEEQLGAPHSGFAVIPTESTI
jgi:hypothetical protein